MSTDSHLEAFFVQQLLATPCRELERRLGFMQQCRTLHRQSTALAIARDQAKSRGEPTRLKILKRYAFLAVEAASLNECLS